MSYPIVKLGDVADFIRGITYKPKDLMENFSDNSVVCMRTTNVQKYLKQDDLLSIPLSFIKDKGKFLIEGDILVSTANSWNLVGKCCWVPKLNYSATAGGFISVLRANKEKLDQRYLYHWFNSQNIQILVRNCGRQTTNISNMDFHRCLSIKIPLPSFSEQRRIASILDKADELRQKRQQSIEKLDQLLQATFIDMFGDPVSNPKGWEIGCIGDMLESVKYGSSSKATLEGEVPILRMNNLTYSGEMDLKNLKYITQDQVDEKYLVKEGDILFNRTNSKELVGKTAVYIGPEPMAYAGYLVRGRTKNNHSSEYISAFLNSPWGKKKLQSMCKNIVGMANINAKEFQSICLPIPPSNLQLTFKNKVIALRESKISLGNQLKTFDDLFQSLQNQAFNGTL